jgi:hypothetical protein
MAPPFACHPANDLIGKRGIVMFLTAENVTCLDNN